MLRDVSARKNLPKDNSAKLRTESTLTNQDNIFNLLGLRAVDVESDVKEVAAFL